MLMKKREANVLQRQDTLNATISSSLFGGLDSLRGNQGDDLHPPLKNLDKKALITSEIGDVPKQADYRLSP